MPEILGNARRMSHESRLPTTSDSWDKGMESPPPTGTNSPLGSILMVHSLWTTLCSEREPDHASTRSASHLLDYKRWIQAWKTFLSFVSRNDQVSIFSTTWPRNPVSR